MVAIVCILSGSQLLKCHAASPHVQTSFRSPLFPYGIVADHSLHEKRREENKKEHEEKKKISLLHILRSIPLFLLLFATPTSSLPSALHDDRDIHALHILLQPVLDAAPDGL